MEEISLEFSGFHAFLLTNQMTFYVQENSFYKTSFYYEVGITVRGDNLSL